MIEDRQVFPSRRQMLSAARSAVMRLEGELASARHEERREVDNAFKTKGSVGKGYWDSRHEIELKLDTARRLVQALEES